MNNRRTGEGPYGGLLRDPPAVIRCWHVQIGAMTAAFYAPGYSGDGCSSLPVPPPSAIQGLVSAAFGHSANGLLAGWRLRSAGHGFDYEKIVPARSQPGPEDFESYRAGYRLTRTPVTRGYLIEPVLSLYLTAEETGAAFRAPHHTLRLGRSQDLAWVMSVRQTEVRRVSSADVEGVVLPLPLPAGGVASFLWAVPSTGFGYWERTWAAPRPHAFLAARQHLTDLPATYVDPDVGLGVPFYEL